MQIEQVVGNQNLLTMEKQRKQDYMLDASSIKKLERTRVGLF